MVPSPRSISPSPPLGGALFEATLPSGFSDVLKKNRSRVRTQKRGGTLVSLSDIYLEVMDRISHVKGNPLCCRQRPPVPLEKLQSMDKFHIHMRLACTGIG